MPRPTQAIQVRIERRYQVAALYVKGVSQHDIGRQLGLSQPTVCRDLEAVRKEWLASQIRDFDTAKAKELAKLDNLEACAWEQFTESCKVFKTYRGCRILLDDEKQPGDVAYLKEIHGYIQTRLKVLGALQPDKHVNNLNLISYDQRPREPHPLLVDLLEEKPALPPPTPEQILADLQKQVDEKRAKLPNGFQELPPNPKPNGDTHGSNDE
jgi:hypothetical protein